MSGKALNLHSCRSAETTRIDLIRLKKVGKTVYLLLGGKGGKLAFLLPTAIQFPIILKTMNVLKTKLTIDDPHNWIGAVQHYWPKLSEQQADCILWNMTCFPFDSDRALEQLYQLYLSSPDESPIKV